MSAETVCEQYRRYQRLLLEHPNAKVYDTNNPGSVLFERIHIDAPIAFSVILRRTDAAPTFLYLTPASSIQ